MLPSLVPNARIWTFNYFSNWLGEAPLQQVESLGDQLLEFVTIRLQGRNIPVVFVAHSFGGIIVANALTTAAARQWKHALQMTVGAIFLGTPFRGSPSVPFARMVAGAADLFGFPASSNLLDRLKPGGLNNLERQFTKVSQELDLNIVCFFEQLRQPLHPFKKPWAWLKHVEITIVPEEAAILEGFPSYGLATSHTKMNCFSSPEDGNYELVAKQIVDLVRGPRHFFAQGYSQNHDFVGRNDILERIEELMTSNPTEHTRVGIWGLGGVGKTSIVTKYVYSIRQACFRRGVSVLWVLAASRERFEESYLAYAAVANITLPEGPREDKLQAVMEWLSNEKNGRWIMILDNADNPDLFLPRYGEMEPNAGSLSRFIPSCPHGSILITSRVQKICRALTGSTTSLIHVDKMPIEECRQMLARVGSRDQDEEDTDRLIKCLECHPLTLANAVAFMNINFMTIRTYLEQWHQSDESRLELLGTFSSEQSASLGAVTTTWVISFTQIKNKNPLAADLLAFMSFIDRQDIPKEILPRDKTAPVQFEIALGILQSYSMISAGVGDSTYTIHGLIQLSMRSWLTKSELTQQSVQKVVDYFDEHFPEPEVWQNWKACSRYLPHLLSLSRYTRPDSSYTEDEVAAIKASEPDIYDFTFTPGSNKRNEIDLFLQAARYLAHVGRYSDALLFEHHYARTARLIFGEDDLLSLRAKNNLALTYLFLERLEEAEELQIDTYERYLRLLGADCIESFNTLNNLCMTMADRGKYPEAIVMKEADLEVQRKVPERWAGFYFLSLFQLATMYDATNELDKAEALYLESLSGLETHRGEHDPFTLGVAEWLSQLGNKREKFEQAERVLTKVVENREVVYGELNENTVRALEDLVVAYEGMGKTEVAGRVAKDVWERRVLLNGESHPATRDSREILLKLSVSVIEDIL